MEIREIKSKKVRKWAEKNKKKKCDERCVTTLYFYWDNSKQGHEFWSYVVDNNPTTKELKKQFPKVFKK